MATYRTLKAYELLRGLNAVNGDYEKLDLIIRDLDNAKNEEWYKNSKTLLNLDNMNDDELSTQNPKLVFDFEFIRQQTTSTQGLEPSTTRNDSDFGLTYFSTSSERDVILGEMSQNSPLEIKPSDEIGNFDRIAFWGFNIGDVRTLENVSYTNNPIYNIPFGNNTIYCEKIENDIISNVPLDTFIADIKFSDYSDLQVCQRKKNDTGTGSRTNTSPNVTQNIFLQSSTITNLYGHGFSNAWVFKSQLDCRNYLNTGDYSKAINYHADYVPPIENDDGSDNKMLYWRQHVWTKPTNKGAKSYVSDLSFEIEIDISNRSYKPIAMKNRVTQNNINDTTININNSDDLLEIRYKLWDSDTWEIKPIQYLYNPVYVYRRTRNIIDGEYKNKIIGCDLSTNIPVFFKDGDIEKFFNDEIEEDSAINSDDLHISENQNGEGDKTKSELNEINTANNLSQILELSTAFLSEFSSFLSDDAELTSLLGGLKLRGNNPISFIVDLFALPFSIDNFVTKQSNNRMFFGSYDKTFTNSYNQIVRTNILKNVFNTFISPTYNDWRDYMCNLYIYLPYVNIQPLDINEVMNKYLSCKVGVDVTTGNIKYYLFANGVMIKSIEGCVRQNLPISATDYYSASMNKIGGASQILSGAMSFTSATSSFTSKAINNRQLVKKGLETQENNLNVGGIVSGVNNMFNGFNEIIKDPPKQSSGNFSSSSAFFDEINCYLIFERTNILYPQNIQAKYNLPSNYVGTLSACHGYTEISNIDLNIDCDESIKENILRILQSGFYVE